MESPGRWNLEAGPDFLDAVLRIGPDRRIVRGDIEVHISPADWSAHGHSADPAYSRVIAHVTYFQAGGPAPGLPAGAVCIPLAPALRANAGFSFDSMDIAAYPYSRNPRPDPPCRAALESLGPDAAPALLESAGEERMRRKARRLGAAAALSGAEQALYEELAGALGYKHNRAPFRRLARTVTAATLRVESAGDPGSAYALLLGVAGLMPPDTGGGWDEETRGFVRGLWDRWWKMRGRWQARCLPAGCWRLAGMRPANHPLRRMAALAAMFADGSALVRELDAAARLPASELPDALGRLLGRHAQFAYWEKRVALGRPPGRGRVALLGPDRTSALIANVLLPFLACSGHDVSGALRALPREEDNAVTKRMALMLLGRDHNPAVWTDALRRQGLQQVSEDFCMAARGACGECRLPAALATWCAPHATH